MGAIALRSTPAAINKVAQLTEVMLQHEQLPIRMHHVIHAGIYARTAYLPPMSLIAGALIKIPTLVILQGDMMVYLGTDAPLHVTSYSTVPAYAGRKQAFFALTESVITMLFKTDVKTVEEAEKEFTDEFSQLASLRDGLNDIEVTGV